MSLYQHKPHPHKTRNLNDMHSERMTIGQKIADKVASGMGSWKFIIIQTIIVTVWIVMNVWILLHPFDPYPLILLNLVFSTQAAYASPLILMSQNRQSAKDRLTAENDYQINLKGEEETRQLIQHLYEQDKELLKQTNMLIDLIQHTKGKKS